MSDANNKFQDLIDAGIAPIKAEYIAENQVVDTDTSTLPADEKGGPTNNVEEADRNTDRKDDGHKRTGMDRQRAKTPLHSSVQLCKATVNGEPCEYGDNCKYSHSVVEFNASKQPDIDLPCPNEREFQACMFGATCRCAKTHTVEFSALSPEEKELARERRHRVEINGLLPELRKAIRKRQLNDKKLKAKTKPVPAATPLPAQTNSGAPSNTDTKEDAPVSEPALKKHKPAETKDEDVSLAKGGPAPASTPMSAEKANTCVERDADLEERIAMGNSLFRDKYILAPLTTCGNMPFRRVCKDYGADVTVGEMAIARKVLAPNVGEWSLLRRHESETVFGVQVAGNKAPLLADCCEVIRKTCSVDFIDLNCGCPTGEMVRHGAGSELLTRQNRLRGIVQAMSDVCSRPMKLWDANGQGGIARRVALTVKMRMGKSHKHLVGKTLTPLIQEWGACAITMHGRTKNQRYTNEADWAYLQDCASLVDIPFIGNGDVLCPQAEAVQQLKRDSEQSPFAGLMIGRGALMKPWIFTELHENRLWDISSSERFDMLKKFCDYGLMHWGSDKHGVELTRRFLLEWQSFLHRYIPVGLLEVVPQKMNLRPPLYHGRNDLETLMASDNSADWVHLSELLLGPPPRGFTFQPKHRARAYAPTLTTDLLLDKLKTVHGV